MNGSVFTRADQTLPVVAGSLEDSARLQPSPWWSLPGKRMTSHVDGNHYALLLLVPYQNVAVPDPGEIFTQDGECSSWRTSRIEVQKGSSVINICSSAEHWSGLGRWHMLLVTLQVSTITRCKPPWVRLRLAGGGKNAKRLVQSVTASAAVGNEWNNWLDLRIGIRQAWALTPACFKRNRK